MMIALTLFGVGLAVWLLRDTSRVSFHVPFFMLWSSKRRLNELLMRELLCKFTGVPRGGGAAGWDIDRPNRD